jgi:hypothetical protein
MVSSTTYSYCLLVLERVLVPIVLRSTETWNVGTSTTTGTRSTGIIRSRPQHYFIFGSCYVGKLIQLARFQTELFNTLTHYFSSKPKMYVNDRGLVGAIAIVVYCFYCCLFRSSTSNIENSSACFVGVYGFSVSTVPLSQKKLQASRRLPASIVHYSIVSCNIQQHSSPHRQYVAEKVTYQSCSSTALSVSQLPIV